MIGEYWIDKGNNGGNSSFLKKLENMDLNTSELEIYNFMETAQNRYEQILFPPLPRQNVGTLDAHMSKSSDEVLEALGRCCILTGVFIPIKEITTGHYKEKLSYSQRHSLWKGANFKGIGAYGSAFVEEALNSPSLVDDNLLKLHREMEVKGFCLKDVYSENMQKNLTSDKNSVWKTKEPEAEGFRKQVFELYPELKALQERIEKAPKKVSKSRVSIKLNSEYQKTL